MVRRKITKNTVVPLVITLLGFAGSFDGAFAQAADPAPVSIQQFEQRLFLKTYANEEMSARVARIEKQVFGQTASGTLQQRIEKLAQTLAKQLAEEQKERELLGGGGGTGRSGGGGGSTTSGAARPEVDAAVNTGQPKTGGDFSTYADPAERARVAAQAAREEQISTLLTEGVELYRQKHGAEAANKFSQVLRLDPHNGQAYFNLGIIKESMGNYQDAWANYKQAALAEPDNSDYAEAVTAIQPKALKERQRGGGGPQTAELKQMASNANAAWKRGEYLTALDLYLQLDAREPNKALVKYNIGSIYMMLKDHHNALSYYKDAAMLAPDDQKYAKAYHDAFAVASKETQARDEVAQKAQRDFVRAGGTVQMNPQMQQMIQMQQMQQMQQQRMPMQQQPMQMPMQQQAMQMPMQQQQMQMQMQTQAPPQPRRPMPVAQDDNRGSLSAAASNSPFAPIMTPMNNGGKNKGRGAFGLAPSAVGMFRPTTVGALGQKMNLINTFGIVGKSHGDGVTVTSIGLASRAAQAGLRVGDDIRAVDGNEVSSPAQINDALSHADTAHPVKFVILRQGNLAVLEL